MEKYYRFAGIEIAAHIPEKWMYTDDRTLEPFRVETVTAPHHFYFEMVEALTPPAGECLSVQPDFMVYAQGEAQVRYIGACQGDWTMAYIRAEHRSKDHFVQLKASRYNGVTSAKTVLNAMQAEHLVARAGGFVFHSAYVNWQGKAILFTAPSGTGKSTQAELWREHRGAEVINGDRSAVIVTEAGVAAGGVPFAGSSQICKNQTLPLAAIVYLAQAPETTIRKLRGFEAFRRVWEGVSVNTWDREDVAMVSEAAQKTVQTVPVYYLSCTPDESAVIALEGALRE